MNPHSLAQRLKTHTLGISEQIIKQANGNGVHTTSNSLNGFGGMVYQYVGDIVDVDQLSDKHKISLFDDSRYEDLNGGCTLDGGISIKG